MSLAREGDGRLNAANAGLQVLESLNDGVRLADVSAMVVSFLDHLFVSGGRAVRRVVRDRVPTASEIKRATRGAGGKDEREQYCCSSHSVERTPALYGPQL